MQQYSLNRKEIDWQEFRNKVYKETKGISKLDKLLSKYPLFFQWLNDSHSSVATPDMSISWKDGRPSRTEVSIADLTLPGIAQIKAERWGDIGYLCIPSVDNGRDDGPEIAQRLTNVIAAIEPSMVKAWIIDLRLNTGGNVWPMIASLAPLIGDGQVGGLKDRSADTNIYIKDGKLLGKDEFNSLPQQTGLPANSKSFIAIVCGPLTANSGEALLLAFKGRPNTTIIGEQTAGFVTSNNKFELEKNVKLSIATAYMQDRSGTVYTEGISPDVEILNGDNFQDLGKDQKVQQAVGWVKMRMVR
jgi:C-terminal processing protease CtpA/Prc